MHAMSAARQRDINSRVHQNTGAMRIRERENAPHQAAQFACREILLANLDQLDTLREYTRHTRLQSIDTAGRAAVGNVVAEHYKGV
jgi:hypothetical protein